MPADSSQGYTPASVGSVPLRIGAGLTLLYIHAWDQAIAASHYVRQHQSWDTIDTLKSMSLPLPAGLAVTIAVLVTLTALSWIFGLYTRLLSLLFLPITLGGLLVANRAGHGFAAESAVLYFFIAIALVLNGSGWLSLDAILKSRKPRKKRRR
ncbi:hypothetical protein BH11VER1_BH11VER1_26920 [soil metagenome]